MRKNGFKDIILFHIKITEGICMNQWALEINRLADRFNLSNVSLPEIQLKVDAIFNVKDYLLKEGWKQIVLVYDKNTYDAAGKVLQDYLNRFSFRPIGILLRENELKQVIADERSLMQVFVETPNDTDALIAVGGGTIHDIVRFVGYKMGIPFISVPTAASVDGFTSKGAPLILRGMKQTVQTASPVAVFADINILKNAPKELTASGFGDMLGKYTSLLDWEISKLIGDEPYDKACASMMRNALENCVKNVDAISKGDENGITILMYSLLQSGLVMQVLNHSRPASGAEHHLSHYWEIQLIKDNKKQLLHGAKVAVATTIIVDLYKTYWSTVLKSEKVKNSKYKKAMEENGQYIQSLINNLPSSSTLKQLIKKVGGPSTVMELGIPEKMVLDSLNQAFHLRDRCTGLFLINQFKEKKLELSFTNRN
ncbi:Glycerol-1-phosphate dehydrogenase [Caldibacillus debilis]|uniref:Glycerol-1-phosphate dehydrogenase n=2 Tax=Caldibacillus debilis TaxID=301148 RepID=A0A150LT42_9BACI|nr:Glycerol-1-phosphate dehydrogenase [Caldibacillus debilis]